MRYMLKFPLERVDGPQRVMMPPGADLAHVNIDGYGALCVWALCSSDDRADATEEHAFVVVGTGMAIQPDWQYIGTARDWSNPVTFFWHVFEERS